MADISTVTVMLLLRASFVFAVACHSVAFCPVQNNSLDARVMCCNLPRVRSSCCDATSAPGEELFDVYPGSHLYHNSIDKPLFLMVSPSFIWSCCFWLVSLQNSAMCLQSRRRAIFSNYFNRISHTRNLSAWTYTSCYCLILGALKFVFQQPVCQLFIVFCLAFFFWPGRGVDCPTPPSAEVKERVELYIYSPSGPSWPVTECIFPLLYPLSYRRPAENTRSHL